VRYFGFLKRVPLLPHVFDAGFKLWLVITNSELVDHIDAIEAGVSAWDGTTVGLHKYGGIQFSYAGSEMGHIHSTGLLDIRFSKAIKTQLLTENRIEPHHVFANSGWISFYIRNKEDRDYAIKLLATAYSNAKHQAERNVTQPDALQAII
jgi:predicted DNA-binding protein (MmcQ/YjbR family)